MERNRALDGLRVIGVLGVVVYHVSLETLTTQILNVGSIGVFICFAITGFLMGYYPKQNEVGEGTLNVGTKYVWKKIKEFWPIHFEGFLISLLFMLFGVWRWNSHLEPLGKLFLKVGLNLTLLQSWVPKQEVYFSFNGASWYLSAIMFFYLVGPWLCSFLEKRNKKVRWMIVAISLIIMWLVQWLRFLVDTEYTTWIAYINPIYNVIQMTIPCMVGIKMREMEEREKKLSPKQVAGYGIFIIALIGMTRNSIGICTLFSFGIYLLLSNNGRVSKLLSSRVFIFLASISLEIYLIHQPLISWCLYLLGKVGIHSNTLKFIFTIVIIGVCSYILKQVNRRIFKKAK